MPTFSEQQPTIIPAKSTPPEVRKPQKITQLQCLDQNTQLKSYFIGWLSQSFKYFPSALQKIYLQLQLVINFIEYRFTISQNRSQVGDYLQNIKYKDLSKKTKILYFLLEIIGPYLKKRVTLFLQNLVDKQDEEGSENNHQQDHENKEQVNNKKTSIFMKLARKTLTIIRFIQKVYALANFINLAAFIYKGKYRTLIQRILNMQMQFVNPENSRVLNFTLMNRNMIWQIYQMVLKHVLPHLHSFVGESLKNVFYLHSYLGVQQQNNDNCAACGETPTMVVQASPCEHVYCFYCSKTVQQQKKECKKCGVIIQQWISLYN